MIVEEAPAKLNLALHILGRRPDGYHELDSLVAFARIGDLVKLEPAESLSLTLTGPFAQDLSVSEDNSLLAAWTALKAYAEKTAQSFAPVAFTLHKHLPVASGIGGGSSDAAAALRGLIRLFKLQIPQPDLMQLALSLGADVPVCLAAGRFRMRGIGEKLAAIELNLPKAVVLINPRLAVPTAQVFQALNIAKGQSYRSEITNPDELKSWRNDMQEQAQTIVPEIGRVMQVLEKQANLHAPRMSGSGATCFAFAETVSAAERAAKNIAEQKPDWWIMPSPLL